MTLCEPSGPALVLGSTQRDDDVDRARAEAEDLPVVRRRTGGGVVLVRPGELVWVDVDLPSGDPLWDADVGVAFEWLGQVWAAAAADLGAPAPSAHRGRMDGGRWGRLVCFAGLGPGEVTVAGRKLVGLAQRRTRAMARFQCALLRRWNPAALVELLALDDGDRSRSAADLDQAAVGLSELGVAASTDDVLAALVARLP